MVLYFLQFSVTILNNGINKFTFRCQNLGRNNSKLRLRRSGIKWRRGRDCGVSSRLTVLDSSGLRLCWSRCSGWRWFVQVFNLHSANLSVNARFFQTKMGREAVNYLWMRTGQKLLMMRFQWITKKERFWHSTNIKIGNFELLSKDFQKWSILTTLGGGKSKLKWVGILKYWRYHYSSSG